MILLLLLVVIGLSLAMVLLVGTAAIVMLAAVRYHGLLARLPLPRILRFRFQDHRVMGKPCRTDRVLDRQGFSLGYDDRLKAARWVSYAICEDSVSVGNARVDRGDASFTRDADVPDAVQLHPDDFKRSGFDRGHLAPSDTIDFTAQSNQETFTMINIVPQHPKLNRQAWRSLENDVRRWTVRHGRLVVMTGPVYKNPPRMHKNMAIPSHFYKLIYSWEKNRCIGFIFPNREVLAKNRWRYARSAARLEEETGLRFFTSPLFWFRRPDKSQRALDWWRG